MVMQMRKVLKELYPDRFGKARNPAEVSDRRLLGRLLGGKLKPPGMRFRRISRKQLTYAVLLALLISQALVLIYYYNKFLILESNVRAAKSQVDVQLQRRKNIVASLNTIVVAYAKHEKEIFERGIDTRKDMVRPAPAEPAKDAKAQNPGPRLAIPGLGISPDLSKILALGESFPGLRLSENYQRLMDALVEVEMKIAEQRMLLNHRANDMTTGIATFPANLYNLVLRFKTPTFYAADADVDKPIKLELAPQ